MTVMIILGSQVDVKTHEPHREYWTVLLVLGVIVNAALAVYFSLRVRQALHCVHAENKGYRQV